MSGGANPAPRRAEPGLALRRGLVRLCREGESPEKLQRILDELVARATGQPADNGALLDLGAVLLAYGQQEEGLKAQAAAIAAQRLYLQSAHQDAKLRLLAFMRPGDLTANTPLEFLLDGSGVELVQCYLDGPPSWREAPEHDVAFVAIGEAAEAAPLLASLDAALEGWPRPVLNRQAALIATLTRHGVSERLASCPALVSPPVRPVARAELLRLIAGQAPSAVLGEGFNWPVIVRPLGTHAGVGMEKVDSPSALEAYLTGQRAAQFYATAFVDYAGPDGLFRKHRIVFIKGRPFISHMAVSPRWMVHYLNADMLASEANRAEEALAMETFDADFATRHAEAFRFLCEAYPLDYFGIDCAETKDGRLLVFEADTALVVHAMDPQTVFPYKKPAMARLFAAFVAMLEDAAQAG